MKYFLLLALLLFGKTAFSQENLRFFKNFPTVSCTSPDSSFHPFYYTCVDQKNRLIGVALSDSTVIIPPEYKDVKLISFSNSCIDNEAYFLAERVTGTYDIFHPGRPGKLTISELANAPEPLQTLNRLYHKQAPPLLDGTRYVADQHVYMLIDSKTGKTSNNYKRIHLFGNFFIGYREPEIDVIDAHLNTIASHTLQGDFYIEMLDSRRFYFSDWWSYASDFEFYYREKYDEAFVNRLFNTAVITYAVPPTKKEARKGAKPMVRKQLLHLPSGKTSYSNYLQVYRIASKDDVYYWALKDTSGRKQVFDVYNEQMECLRASEITAPEKFHEFQSLSHYYEYEQVEYRTIPGQPAFYLENPEGKLAILHHNGTRLTDFIWDRKVAFEGMRRDSTPVFLVYAEDTTPRYGILVDKNNLPLFGHEYASVSELGSQRYYFYRSNQGKSEELRILSAHFEVLLDSVQRFYEYDPGLLNMGKEPYRLYKNREQRIFIFTGREVSPLLPSFFQDPKSRNRISKSGATDVLVVDEQGYLVSEEPAKKVNHTAK